jgi:hypothetical protein
MLVDTVTLGKLDKCTYTVVRGHANAFSNRASI